MDLAIEKHVGLQLSGIEYICCSPVPPIFLASRPKGWSPGKSLIENLEC